MCPLWLPKWGVDDDVAEAWANHIRPEGGFPICRRRSATTARRATPSYCSATSRTSFRCHSDRYLVSHIVHFVSRAFFWTRGSALTIRWAIAANSLSVRRRATACVYNRLAEPASLPMTTARSLTFRSQCSTPTALTSSRARCSSKADLGRPDEIGRVFAGFQQYLYQPQAAA